MSVEVDVLLQEAKESIEAAQNYRSELQQRLNGLNQARKQVPHTLCPHPTASTTSPHLRIKKHSTTVWLLNSGVMFLLLFLLIFLQPDIPP